MSAKPETKKTHAAVDYEHPASDYRKRCAVCVHFIHGEGSQPHCQIVQDPIRYGDWCKRFESNAQRSGMR
jgi:hypothetical protein